MAPKSNNVIPYGTTNSIAKSRSYTQVHIILKIEMII